GDALSGEPATKFSGGAAAGPALAILAHVSPPRTTASRTHSCMLLSFASAAAARPAAVYSSYAGEAGPLHSHFVEAGGRSAQRTCSAVCPGAAGPRPVLSLGGRRVCSQTGTSVTCSHLGKRLSF